MIQVRRIFVDQVPWIERYRLLKYYLQNKTRYFRNRQKSAACKCRSAKWESPEHRDVPAHTMSNEEDVYHVTVETTQETIRKVVYCSIVF